jgi:hypothetical protein
MDAAVLGAAIGVVGVGVGAGAAFGGVVYQQRYAARAALSTQRRTEAMTAAERLLTELLAVQQILSLMFNPAGSPGLLISDSS